MGRSASRSQSAESISPSEHYVDLQKHTRFRVFFGRSDAVLRGKRQGSSTLPGARFARIIVRDRRSTSYDHNSSETWKGNNAKRNGMKPRALYSTAHFWMTIIWLLMLPISKKWGSLADLFRFWRYQGKKKIEEVLQTSCVSFDDVRFKNWGIDEFLQTSFVFNLAEWQTDG